MKRLLIVGILGALVLGGIVLSTNKEVTYTAPEQVFVEVEKEVSDIDVRIKQAQEAAKDDIKVAAQKAYDSAYDQAMLEIELVVTSTFRGEIEEREKVLQASSTAY
jgi:F0F1-type ATP synthase epsilon subunit